VGVVLAVHVSLAQHPWQVLAIGPILALAFGAKYAALLFIPPVLAILLFCTLLKRGWVSMLVRGTLGVLSLALVGTLTAVIVIHFDPAMLHALAATTTNRTAILTATRLGLAEHVVEMVGLSFAIGLFGLVFAGKKHVLIAFLFFGSAMLVPAYHIYKAEVISLDKHLGYSMFFMMPVAGLALASLRLPAGDPAWTLLVIWPGALLGPVSDRNRRSAKYVFELATHQQSCIRV
jgi:hypothetical protein